VTDLCWFCQKGIANSADAANVKMHGNVTRQEGYIRWRKLEISIPRCTACKQAHAKVYGTESIGWLLGFVVSVPIVMGILNALFPSGYHGPVLIPLWVGGWLLYIVPFAIVALPTGYAASAIGRLAFLKGAKSEEEKKKFPAVQSKIIEGWVIGEKPKGAGPSTPSAQRSEPPHAPPANVFYVDADARVTRSLRDQVNWRALGQVAIVALAISSLLPFAWWTLQSRSVVDPTFLPFLSTWGSLTFVIIMLIGWIRVRSNDYKRSEGSLGATDQRQMDRR